MSAKKNNKNNNDSLIKKIVVTLCIMILTVFPVIVIIVCVSVAIFEFFSGEEQVIRDTPAGVRASNEELYGDHIYLDQTSDNAYVIVSETDSYEKNLEWQEGYHSYYDRSSHCYIWYDTSSESWQYWYRDISSKYGNYGWMEYGNNGWMIEKSDNDWIKLSEKYDRKTLWHISE